MKSVASRLRPLLGGCAIVLLLGAVAPAEDLALLPEILGAAQLYGTDPHSGLALAGRDPVAYHLDARARPGVGRYEVVWGGTAWRFAGEANRAAFLRTPNLFAPRLAGYDAEAAAEGRLVETDPDLFLIRSGRLYLFRTETSRERFRTDPGLASRAEANWPKLEAALVRG
jgi:hypothetical protein